MCARGGGRRACVRTFLVHARHFRSLATDERTAGLLAALGDALHYLRRDGHVELAATVVVEEVQWFRALHEQVVHRHRDEVDAYKWAILFSVARYIGGK